MKEKEDINITGPIDVKTYSKIHFDQMPKLDGFEKYSVSPILKLDAEYDSRNVEKCKDKLVGLANGDTVTSEINAQPYTPNFLRPIPECDSTLENFIVDDAFWLFPGVLPEPCWDYTLGNNCSRVKTLMKKSCNGQLIKSNTELIISTFKSDPEAVIHYGIHSNQFCKLVIQNKDLALEFLNFMSPFPSIIEYYNNLAQTKVNLNSMELFSKLVDAHELPTEYYSFYIHNLINSCTEDDSKRTNESDSGSTNGGIRQVGNRTTSSVKNHRLVRMVSVLVEHLLKQRVISPQEMRKINCVEFFEANDNISEAVEVLNLIKEK